MSGVKGEDTYFPLGESQIAFTQLLQVLVTDGIFQNEDQVSNHAIQQGKGVGRLIYRDIDGNGVVDGRTPPCPDRRAYSSSRTTPT